jgi:hypothetical protein
MIFFPSKIDVNVPSKSNKETNFLLMKIAGNLYIFIYIFYFKSLIIVMGVLQAFAFVYFFPCHEERIIIFF